ncbi:MAG: LPS assembly lipoprotein LptE [Prevotellaceae bacterium]|jgi:hypothetical protein|nr:LPS assembly lipoprotein LptE [Prevotellaceae bacterium]
MASNKNQKQIAGYMRTLLALFAVIMFAACTVSYKFNAGMIDYTKIKSISIADFPNMAEGSMYPMLSQEFSEAVRDIFTRQTRLQILRTGGDMHLEGEITGYLLTPMAISADSYSSETKLTLTVKIRFSNNKQPEEDFEKSYSAYQSFSSNQMLNDIQAELLKTIMTEICENIYNDTAGKW